MLPTDGSNFGLFLSTSLTLKRIFRLSGAALWKSARLAVAIQHSLAIHLHHYAKYSLPESPSAGTAVVSLHASIFP
jgi:hypothetical protein